MRQAATFLLAAAIVCSPLPRARGVDVYLSLSSHKERLEMAVAGFAPATPTLEESRLSRELQGVVRDDLLFSRYFNLVEEGPLYTGDPGQIKEWASRGAGIVVAGTLRLSGTSVILTGQMFDAESGEKIWEKKYSGDAASSRRLAHELNDDVILRFTGERGIAHTQIAFVNNRTGHKELYLIDYDGRNFRHLTIDNSIALLPRWAPGAREIIYTSYLRGNPDLYAIGPDGKGRRVVSAIQGLNTAASYSADGTRIALTISRGGIPSIYLITPKGQIIKRLTPGKTIETSPSFSPNGREIVFVSDRAGNPQLYIMDVDGGNVRRIVDGGYSDSPAWSPRGDKIVFCMRQSRENFDLYLYDLASTTVTRLTQGERDNENPSWSPDGRFIVFSSSRTGRHELYVMAADGSGVRRLANIPAHSFTPSWSS